jgi:hypothetical protein
LTDFGAAVGFLPSITEPGCGVMTSILLQPVTGSK